MHGQQNIKKAETILSLCASWWHKGNGSRISTHS